MAIKSVKVGDDEVEVVVNQKAKMLWIATGSYTGKDLEVAGKTEAYAISCWAELARSRSISG